jgi:acyl dehydratase
MRWLRSPNSSNRSSIRSSPSDYTTLGRLVANLGYDKVVFPNPVFIGDTLRSESECVAVRESKSRPNAGIVTWAHRSFNQRDEPVCECTRTALLLKKPNG